MMKKYYVFLFPIFFLLLSCKKTTTPPNTSTPEDFSFLKGVDISFLPEIREAGFVAKNSEGVNEDMLTTLRNAGVNVFRLRLWVNPSDGHAGFEEVKNLSAEIKNTGAKVWLTVHYSDTWADPGNQSKPTAWSGLPFQQLKDSVYIYTKKIINEIHPDYIQIGNEINNGMLWPDGSYNYLSNLKLLLKEGIRGVRETSTSTKIILHYAGHKDAVAFYSSLGNLDYDIIGISYYPKWNGKNLDSLNSSINSLGTTFQKEILIAETSYPFTFSWNDWTNNVIGSDSEIIPAYPATELGQKLYMQSISNIIKNNPKGLGYCYWGAEWVSFKGNTATNGSSWENQAFWDFNGKALPVMEAYSESR